MKLYEMNLAFLGTSSVPFLMLEIKRTPLLAHNN